MAEHVRETERKYEAPAEVELPDPGRLFDLAVGSQDEVELDATYFDTADLRLARAGVTMRRRVGGDDAGWHLNPDRAGATGPQRRSPTAAGTRSTRPWPSSTCLP